jgi:hypothetical protein
MAQVHFARKNGIFVKKTWRKNRAEQDWDIKRPVSPESFSRPLAEANSYPNLSLD